MPADGGASGVLSAESSESSVVDAGAAAGAGAADGAGGVTLSFVLSAAASLPSPTSSMTFATAVTGSGRFVASVCASATPSAESPARAGTEAITSLAWKALSEPKATG